MLGDSNCVNIVVAIVNHLSRTYRELCWRGDGRTGRLLVDDDRCVTTLDLLRFVLN